MALYNLSQFNNTATNLSTYFQVSNEITSSWFGGLAALAFFVIVFVSLKNFGNKPALAASVSLTTLFCLFGRTIQLVPDQVLFMAIALSAITAVGLYVSK